MKACVNFRFLIGGRRYPEGRRYNMTGVLLARYLKKQTKKFDTGEAVRAIAYGKRGRSVERAMKVPIQAHWVESWLQVLRNPNGRGYDLPEKGTPAREGPEALNERCPNLSAKVRRLWRGR